LKPGVENIKKVQKMKAVKFSCDICPRQFGKKKLLNNHKENHTFNHRCEECDVNMANMVEVGKHRSALHKGVTFTRCTECKTGWMKESSLNLHKAQFHNTKLDEKEDKPNSLSDKTVKKEVDSFAQFHKTKLDAKEDELNSLSDKKTEVAEVINKSPASVDTDYEEVELVDMVEDDMEDSTSLSESKFREELLFKDSNVSHTENNSSIISQDSLSYNDSGIHFDTNSIDDSDISFESSIFENKESSKNRAEASISENKESSKNRTALKNKIFESLKKVISGKSKNTETITAELEKLKQELETSKITTREAQEKQNTLNLEIRKLKQHIQNNSQTTVEEQNKMKKELEQKETDFEQLQKIKDEEILNLKIKMEKSQSRINKAKDLVTECLEYKKKCAELSKKFKETETDFLLNKKQLDEKTESLNNANKTISELRNNINELRSTMETSNKEKTQLEQNLELSKSQNTEKTDKLNIMQERLKKAEAGSDKRVGNVLQSLRAELDKLGSQNAKLREILKAKDEELLRHKGQASVGVKGQANVGTKGQASMGVIRKVKQENMPGPASKRLRR